MTQLRQVRPSSRWKMSLSSAAKSSPDGEPEGAGGLEGSDEGLAPLVAPVEVFLGGAAVFVDIVFVADVEGGSAKARSMEPSGMRAMPGDAVLVVGACRVA